jgi:2-succinyl-6-hydroxy-2,4-cyclohexadiene-1-carboxylate synthase
MLAALHGFTETDQSWREVFGKSGLDVATPLLPGHGWSPCPPDATLASVADHIAERYADQAPFDLLGYSMGGRIAIQLALRHPEMVRRLILVSTQPGISDEAVRQQRLKDDIGLALILEEDGISPFVAWWESSKALKPFKPLSSQAIAHLRGRRLNQDPICLAAALRQLGQGSCPDLWPHIHELAMPVLAVAGAADERYVDAMRRMAEQIPQGSYQMIDEAGHAVHRERPDVLVNLVRGFCATRT